MKRFSILALLAILAIPAMCQTITTVTGTVRDPNGVPFVNCTVLPVFANVSGGATPTVTATGGLLYSPTSPVGCTVNGTFSVNVVANGSITPASTHWNFTICSAPGTVFPDPGSLGPQCFQTGNITISGSSQDISGNISAVPPAALIYANLTRSLGAYQGTTSVGITDTSFHALIAAASDITLPANLANVNPRKIRCHGDGVYTNAAASLLNVDLQICTVSGCGSGTVVSPAGCAVVTTNQANNLTNGQWSLDCTLTTTTTLGSSGTFMAKSTVCANLGTTTAAVSSCFQDTATAVSAAVDETSTEFFNPAFKFSSSNAGNSAIVHDFDCKVDN
jgi:hypothetical protein